MVGDLLRRPVRRALNGLGYEVHRLAAEPSLPRDFRERDHELWQAVSPYTMTTPHAVVVLAEAVRYLVGSSVRGAMVECGVWRGGSMLTIARTLLELERSDVDLYLFDTFEGMSAPTERDVLWTGRPAAELLAEGGEESIIRARASLGDVQRTMSSVAYPAERIHYVEGKVEETIPDRAPDEIALLRLDTDWYESTLHELTHLYPRLAPGGVLVIDDYGWWRGAGEATDEYFTSHGPVPFLVRIDDEGRRFAVKPTA
jgi:hypothetical protein